MQGFAVTYMYIPFPVDVITPCAIYTLIYNLLVMRFVKSCVKTFSCIAIVCVIRL